MKILIWTPPWCMRRGDFFFLKNAFDKHLIPQGKTLAAAGHQVEVCAPDAFRLDTSSWPENMRPVPMSCTQSQAELGTWQDPSPELYRNGIDSPLSTKITSFLRPILPAQTDVILLWENPVPFLETLYPEALIVHQMPGGFARAPYPQTVVFDPLGLYKRSSLNQIAPPTSASPLVADFKRLCQTPAFDAAKLLPDALKSQINGRPLTLLPLQISDHYGFQVDTGFTSQQEFCLTALAQAGADRDVLITEYTSPHYQEEVMSADFLTFVQSQFPRAHFSPKLREIPSVSQQLLPAVDEVLTATSGLGMQALAFDISLQTVGQSFLSPLQSAPPGSAEADAWLEFILTQNQPLAEKVKSDGAFLSHMFEEMQARKGKPPAERTPRFADIDPEYPSELLRGFRAEANAKSVKLFAPQAGVLIPQDQFAAKLSTLQPSLVSFDLFDTLIMRALEAPADLYVLLRKRAQAAGLDLPFGFEHARLDAELEARTHANGAEITLAQIYDILQAAHDLPPQTRTALEALEQELQIACAEIRPAGMALWKAAGQAGIKRCITSDMYLPEPCIAAILAKIGLNAPLYLSASHGVTKKSGQLFDLLLASQNLHAQQVLHVGDTQNADIAPAKAKGLHVHYLPKAMQQFRDQPGFDQLFTRRKPLAPLERSAIVGTLANRLFDTPQESAKPSLFKGNAESLGYGAIGPLVLGFASWLRHSALSDGVKHLHFLSREGRILKDAFDALEQAAPSGITTTYLLGSRRAIRVAGLTNAQDVRRLASLPIDPTATLGDLLLGRFGLPYEQLPPTALAASGFSSATSRIAGTQKSKQAAIALAVEIAPQILENARQERATYLDYLAAQGLNQDTPQGIVDVGWEANMQADLGKLLGKPLLGYYCATQSGALQHLDQGHRIRGYLADFADHETASPILQYRLLVEHMLCDTTPSLTAITRTPDGSFAPHYQSPTPSQRRLDLITPLQSGARAFCADVIALLGSTIGDLRIPPDIAASPLKAFLSAPDPADAALFLGQQTKDNFAASQGQSFLAPGADHSANKAQSYWKAGADAINGTARTSSNAQPLSLRAKLALRLWFPILKSHLSDEERGLYTSNPQLLFARARHPVMVWAGRTAGLG